MPALPPIELSGDVFQALQGLAQESHAPSLEAFVERVLLHAIEEAE